MKYQDLKDKFINQIVHQLVLTLQKALELED